MGKKIITLFIFTLICLPLFSSMYPREYKKSVDFYGDVKDKAVVIALNVNDTFDYNNLLNSYYNENNLTKNSESNFDFDGINYFVKGKKTFTLLDGTTDFYKVGYVMLFSNIINKTYTVSISVGKNTDLVIANTQDNIRFSKKKVSSSENTIVSTNNQNKSFDLNITNANNAYYIVKEIYAKLNYSDIKESKSSTEIKIEVKFN